MFKKKWRKNKEIKKINNDKDYHIKNDSSTILSLKETYMHVSSSFLEDFDPYCLSPTCSMMKICSEAKVLSVYWKKKKIFMGLLSYW